jgi:aquaporin Z
MSSSLGSRCAAEFVGTFWLVLGGCGSAVLAAGFPYVATPLKDANFFGLGFLGVAFAFGLTVLTGAYALGHVSGGHFNPAVSLGLWAGKRFPAGDLLPYIIAQVVGATVAGGLIFLVAGGRPGFTLAGSNPLAANGYAAHSRQLLAPRLPDRRSRPDFVRLISSVPPTRAPSGLRRWRSDLP